MPPKRFAAKGRRRHRRRPGPPRQMTIVAQDPSVRRGARILMARVAIPADELIPGPTRYRVQIVDYDATTRRFYAAHDLPRGLHNEPPARQRGSLSLLRDYRFHAQNVYALVRRTLARFKLRGSP